MVTQHDHDIPSLDELGSRFDYAIAAREPRSARPRKALLLIAASFVVLVVTPAVASITGVSITGVFNPHSSIEEALPEAFAVINPKDPATTGEDLERLGFTVEWSLVEDSTGDSPTKTREVSAPPAGTEILAVLNENGSSKITESTRALLIEVAPKESKILRSHR